MKAGAYIAVAAVILALGIAIFSLQLRLDMSRSGDAAGEQFMYLPDAEYIKVASLGYDELVADILWLEAIQRIGEKKISGQGYDWIYKALDTVTTLDPKFVEAYETGGLILTIVAEKADLSNKLLIKGTENNPDVWQLPFYAGFNYFYFMRDYKNAALYLGMASRIEGCPDFVTMLASRLYVQADEISTSLDFLQSVYDRTTDEELRKLIMQRVNKLRALNIARALQQVVDEYRKKTGHPPRDLETLVREGIITRVPEEPNGGYFFLDNEGKVKSSKVDVSLGVYLKK